MEANSSNVGKIVRRLVGLSNPRCSSSSQSRPGLTRGIEHSQLDLLLLQIPPGTKTRHVELTNERTVSRPC